MKTFMKIIAKSIIAVLIFVITCSSFAACSQSDFVVLGTQDSDDRIVCYMPYNLFLHEYVDLLVNEDLNNAFIPAHIFGNVGTLTEVNWFPDLSFTYRFDNGVVISTGTIKNNQIDIDGYYKQGAKSIEFDGDDLYQCQVKSDSKTIWVEIYENVLYSYINDTENNCGRLRSILCYKDGLFAEIYLNDLKYRSHTLTRESYERIDFLKPLLNRQLSKEYFDNLFPVLQSYDTYYEIVEEKKQIHGAHSYMEEKAFSKSEYEELVLKRNFGEDFLPMELFAENFYGNKEGVALFFEGNDTFYRYAFSHAFDFYGTESKTVNLKSGVTGILSDIVNIYKYDGESVSPKERYENYLSVMINAVAKKYDIDIELAKMLYGGENIFFVEEGDLRFDSYETRDESSNNIYRGQINFYARISDQSLKIDDRVVCILNNTAYVYVVESLKDMELEMRLLQIVFFGNDKTVELDLSYVSSIVSSKVQNIIFSTHLKPLPEGASEDEISENTDSTPDYYDLFIVSRAEEAVEYFTSLINEYKYQPKG